MQEKSWEIKEIPAWVSQKGASALDLRESCLDHRNESYQCAYDREQALGDMREVFDAWGKFCGTLNQ